MKELTQNQTQNSLISPTDAVICASQQPKDSNITINNYNRKKK